MGFNRIQVDDEYVERLLLVNSNSEKMKKELNEKQKELFDRYCESSSELSDILTLDAFKAGFIIAMQLAMNCIKD